MSSASHHVVNDADGTFFTQSGEPWINSIGGVIDVVLIVALILSGFSWFFHRKNAKRRQQEASSRESYVNYSKRARLSYQELVDTFEEIDKSEEEKQKRNDWNDLIE